MRKAIVIVLVALVVWIGVDLYRPVHTDLRSFDAVEVARLETAMWRSYYDHRQLDLFTGLIDLLHREYRMPFWRATLSAYHAAKAAVVFQRGRERLDYELALPDLVSYYRLIRRSSSTDFEPEPVARLELEWWILHRQRDPRLETALADLQAAIYHEPASVFMKHAHARAEAMVLRDEKTERLTSSDWNHIEQLLEVSWNSLNRVL